MAIALLLWMAVVYLTIIVGTAYLVFFQGISPWWWALSVFLIFLLSEIKVGSTEDK